MSFDDKKLYRIGDIARKPNNPDSGRIPAGQSTIWLWVSRDQFPQPIKLGPRTTAWRGSDLNAWLDNLSNDAA